MMGASILAASAAVGPVLARWATIRFSLRPLPPVTSRRGLHPGVHELGTAAKELESLHRLAPPSESDGESSDDEEGSALAARHATRAEELIFELDREFVTSPQGVKSHSSLPFRRLQLPTSHMPFARR